jgi:hypothetical protein
MIGSFPTCRARVLCFGSSSIDREPVAIRTCARMRWRAHSDINPGLNRTSNPASHPSVATTLLPVGNGRLAARTLERSGPNTVGARALAAAFSNLRRDMSGPRSLNLTGYLSRWSFRTLLQSFQESSCVLRILFSPVPVLSLSVLHDRNMQTKDARSHEQCTREYE